MSPEIRDLIRQMSLANLCTLSISGKERNMTQERVHEEGQQHPIKLYLLVWGWLFVLSTCSYLVDYFGLEGYLIPRL